MKRCALCTRDPVTSKWTNPTNGRAEPLGISESNWACDKCLSKKQNRGWRNTPSEEVYGVEVEHAGDTKPIPDSEPGPFETPTCIEIMRRYCLGQTQRAIASDVDCQLSFVIKTIRYWKTNYGHFIGMLKESLDKKGRVIQ